MCRRPRQASPAMSHVAFSFNPAALSGDRFPNGWCILLASRMTSTRWLHSFFRCDTKRPMLLPVSEVGCVTERSDIGHLPRSAAQHNGATSAPPTRSVIAQGDWYKADALVGAQRAEGRLRRAFGGTQSGTSQATALLPQAPIRLHLGNKPIRSATRVVLPSTTGRTHLPLCHSQSQLRREPQNGCS